MKTFAHVVTFTLVLILGCSPVWATCGGGGGGGGGGTSGTGGDGGPNPVVYHVPWKMRDSKTPAPNSALVLYWFPASADELKKSSLRESRDLSLYASQCVDMQLADNRVPNADKLIGTSNLPVAVLAASDGTVINRVDNKDGKLKVGDVEKLVGGEIKQREAALDVSMNDAKTKAAAGDKDAAIKLYQSVLAQKCMFPKKAKDAAKQLKNLGVENVADVMTAPNFDPATSAAIVKTMKRGLVAENKAQYVLADRLYTEAAKMDPADPTPLRYLGELHRHDIGDWDNAKVYFNRILEIQSDPLSTAVALHGLGKITIHEGEFKKGLHLMEQSVDLYPLALAYRNLAVYWNSEYDAAKGGYYTEKALAMAPDDPYNLIFAAVFMAANGKKDEALKVAIANMNLLPASYNLAAIFAQNGQKDKALELLKRHFYKYERYQEVRTKEMMEARVDAMFDSLRQDKDFLALTKFADGRLPMVMSPKAAEQMMMKN